MFWCSDIYVCTPGIPPRPISGTARVISGCCPLAHPLTHPAGPRTIEQGGGKTACRGRHLDCLKKHDNQADSLSPAGLSTWDF